MPERMENAVTLVRCLECGGVGFESASGRLFGPHGFFDCPEDGYHGPTQDVLYVPASSATEGGERDS